MSAKNEIMHFPTKTARFVSTSERAVGSTEPPWCEEADRRGCVLARGILLGENRALLDL